MTIVNDEELLLKLANAIDEEQLVDWHSVKRAPQRRHAPSWASSAYWTAWLESHGLRIRI